MVEKQTCPSCEKKRVITDGGICSDCKERNELGLPIKRSKRSSSSVSENETIEVINDNVTPKFMGASPVTPEARGVTPQPGTGAAPTLQGQKFEISLETVEMMHRVVFDVIDSFAKTEGALKLSDAQAKDLAPLAKRIIEKRAPAWLVQFGDEVIYAVSLAVILTSKVKDAQEVKKRQRGATNQDAAQKKLVDNLQKSESLKESPTVTPMWKELNSKG